MRRTRKRSGCNRYWFKVKLQQSGRLIGDAFYCDAPTQPQAFTATKKLVDDLVQRGRFGGINEALALKKEPYTLEEVPEPEQLIDPRSLIIGY